MNSCTSTFESACAPPLRMFIIGTGSSRSPLPSARCAYSGFFASAAAAWAAAIDTPRMAFAPSLLLVGVPSRSIIFLSSVPLVELAADDGLGDLAVDVRDRLEHALAEIALLVAVAQLERLALAGRRARRHGRPAKRAARERDVDFDSRDFHENPEFLFHARWRFSRFISRRLRLRCGALLR